MSMSTMLLILIVGNQEVWHCGDSSTITFMLSSVKIGWLVQNL
jgi:hypothetical protein